MKKLTAAVLAATVLTWSAVPAMAETDPLQSLQSLIQQEQAPSQSSMESAGAGSVGAMLAPSTAEVQMDVDQEAGDTQEARVASYVAGLEQSLRTSADFATTAKLGLAYQLQGNHDKAVTALNKALAMEPGAEALYDALAQSYSQQAPGIKVYVGGEMVTFDQQPVIISDRTLVPIRFVIEKMGGQVAWDDATATVTVTLGDTRVEVTQDSTAARVNGQPVTLDVPATIINGRTMVPLRFVSESLSKQVDYHPGTAGTAVISIIDK